MSLKIYNVLDGKKEEFVPLEEGKVKMYACGITVSDNAHIGHVYQAVIFDTIRKYLRSIGYDVTYVRNYTDVDDKIIINARKKGMNPLDYAEFFIAKTDKEFDELGLEPPTIQSRATECINDMIDFISKLIEKGHAYATPEGNVYFRVSSFKEYGKLSHQIIDETMSGVRKDIEPGKEDDRDFALWKAAGDDEIFWESPWGKGRPGWHIECSTMSMKYLGETLDIHGGGKDLRFPHHENEIAQSESLTGKQFSRFWMHNGLVKINGQKMSKSLGNGILFEDLLKEYHPDVIKMTMLLNNYKSDLNIVDGLFTKTEEQVYNFYKLINQVNKLKEDRVANKESKEYKEVENNFREAMDNDFNTSQALSYLFNYVTLINNAIKENNIQTAVDYVGSIVDHYEVLGLLQQDPETVINSIRNKYLSTSGLSVDDINKMVEDRINYKNEKNYEEADKIRNTLAEKGIIINDRSKDIDWDIKFNN